METKHSHISVLIFNAYGILSTVELKKKRCFHISMNFAARDCDKAAQKNDADSN